MTTTAVSPEILAADGGGPVRGRLRGLSQKFSSIINADAAASSVGQTGRQ